jgi:hypothetical protein
MSSSAVSDHKLLNGILTKPINNNNNNNKLNKEHQNNGKILIDNSFNKQYHDEIVTKFGSNNIIEGMFESIKKEIESNLDSKEVRDRLTSYLSLIQNAYNETCVQFIRSKIETQEVS